MVQAAGFDPLMLMIVSIVLGLGIGMSVGQASTCAVTAAKEIVHQRRATLLVGFILAGGLAGLVSLPLAWLGGVRFGLPPEAPLALPLLAGAALLALGALVNDACLFGTLARIARGEVRFLAVPVGLFLGYALVARFGPAITPVTPNAFASPSPPGLLLVLVSLVLVAGSWAWLRKLDRPKGRWPLHASMTLLGIGGSLLFLLTPGWTYSDAVRHLALASEGVPSSPLMLSAVLTGFATIGGALGAGVQSDLFRYRRPGLIPLLRSLAGGALMAIGAWFVPGGNDQLLLWAVPGGSVSGLVAYILMSGLILGALFLRRLLAGRPPAMRLFARRIWPLAQ